MITDAGLVYLRGLTSLRRLDLSQTGIRGSGLQQLQGLSQLKELSLEDLPLDDDVSAFLSGLRSLEVLELHSEFITDAGLEHLAGLTKLKAPRASLPVGDQRGVLIHLRGMHQLEHLDISTSKVDRLLAIQRLVSLRALHLSFTSVSDDDMTLVAGLAG